MTEPAPRTLTINVSEFEAKVTHNWLESALNGADVSRRTRAIQRVVKKLWIELKREKRGKSNA
jgi:hypothetical protein